MEHSDFSNIIEILAALAAIFLSILGSANKKRKQADAARKNAQQNTPQDTFRSFMEAEASETTKSRFYESEEAETYETGGNGFREPAEAETFKSAQSRFYEPAAQPDDDFIPTAKAKTQPKSSKKPEPRAEEGVSVFQKTADTQSQADLAQENADTPANALRRELSDGEGLRNAFVLKEILQTKF